MSDAPSEPPAAPRTLAAAIDARESEAEIPALWASTHRDAFRMIDVREPHELDGPLGQIPGIENLPLLRLLSEAESFDPHAPLLLVCRSGRRSGAATRVLASRGFTVVASVEGGMLAWNVHVWNRTEILAEEQVANTSNLTEAIDRSQGPPQVSAGWVAQNLGRFRLIDLREAEELELLGRIAQVEHIALDTFMAQAGLLDQDAPLVLVCSSGRRSARAAEVLENAGFSAVASLEGGLLGWRASGLPWI